jgi:hypothetical protein
MRGGFAPFELPRLWKVCALLLAAAASPLAAQQSQIPVTQIVLADRTYELPTAWIKDFATLYLRQPERPAFELIALRNKEKLTLAGGDVTSPKLRTLRVTGQLGGDSEFQQHFDKRNAEAKRERDFAKPHETGFTFTDKIGQYLFIAPATWRWKEQPLFVYCQESMRGELCSADFRLSEKIAVNYDFFSSEVPRKDWAKLDREVIEFLAALEAKK